MNHHYTGILDIISSHREALWDIHTHTLLPNTEVQQSVYNAFPYQQPLIPNEKGWYSVGLHPWHVANDWCSVLKTIENLAAHPRVVFIGETGLDRAISAPFSLQEEVFAAHIELSEKQKKPLLIHCVRAYPDVIRWRKQKKASQPWIFHGYQANTTLTEQLLRVDKFYFSFGEKLAKEQIATIFANLPLSRCFLETDNSTTSI
ncbi:MAG: TatD family hydrolase, partial [Flammeovirgaceae bacterium]|nr:TatD family hydrolase [Flammeovirgaceae bacterium]